MTADTHHPDLDLIRNRPFFCSWSGGKDSCLALHRAIQAGGKPALLLTMLCEDGILSRSHGLSRSIIEGQANRLKLDLRFRSADWNAYEAQFLDALHELRKSGIEIGVFGDIDIEDHRAWVQRVCRQAGITPVHPLWQESRTAMLNETLQLGYEARVVVVNTRMLPRSFLGRTITPQTIRDMEMAGIDPCGELGEYHTVITNGPRFSSPLPLVSVYDCQQNEYWFKRMELQLNNPAAIAAPGQPLEPDFLQVYKTTGSTALSIHGFNPADHQPGDRRPAMVFFFGGGWMGGVPSQFYPHCRHLANRGMVTLSVEYRVHSRHGTTPFECVADGKSAMRWIRAHAPEMGIDPQRIAAGGGSAGAQVAAATATSTAFDDPSDDPATSCRPDALVLFNPVYDNGPEGYGHDRVKDRWQEFSPLHNITPAMPPTIVFLGSCDSLIPVATANAFRQSMQAVGVRSDLHVYEGQMHGFFNFAGGANPYYQRTLDEADRFLVSLGYLPSPA